MKGRRKRRGGLPFQGWPLWKVVVVLLPITAIWSAFPLLVPPYVPRWAIVASATLFVVNFGSVLWVWFRDNAWGRGALNFGMVPAWFGLSAIRAWMVVLPDDREWTLVFLGAGMAAAAVLPFVAPRLSDFLWEEQTVPRTRIGRAFFAFCLAIAPSAGVMGASYGMWTTRWYGIEAAMLGGGDPRLNRCRWGSFLSHVPGDAVAQEGAVGRVLGGGRVCRWTGPTSL